MVEKKNALKRNRAHARLAGRSLMIALFLGLGTAFLPHAEPASAPGQSSSGGALRVDVELVTLEVVVLDKKGNPARDMKKEDFRLFEDGKQQQIMTFDAVSENTDQPMPTSLSDVEDQNNRGKIVLILFDDSTITPSQSKQTRDAAEKYVKQHMRPWDLFGVATYGRSLKVVQNFTRDAGKIVEAIRLPAASYATPVGPGAPRNEQQLENFPGQRGRNSGLDSLGQNPATSQEAMFRAMTLLRNLNLLASSLSRVKGRKSVFLFSEDFSITGDGQTELRNAVDSAQRSNVSFFTIDAKGLNSRFGPQGSQGFLRSPKTGTSSGSERSGFFSLRALSQRLIPMTDLINTSAGASMFQQKGGGGQGAGGQQGGGQGTGGAGQGRGGQSGSSPGGNEGGNNNSGFGNNQPGSRSNNDPNASQNRNDPFGNRDNVGRDNMDQFRQQAVMDNILRSLALESGGQAIFNTNNFNEGLDRVDLELSNYYVLGFQSSNPKRDGKFRKLEVKTDEKGVKLKYRKGYTDPRPLDVLAGSKGERSLMSAISSPTPANQLPVLFRPVYFYDSPELVRIPVSAKIRRGTIELKKKGSQLVNAVNVMGVAYAEDGSVAARFSEIMNIAVDKDKEDLFRGQDIAYRNYFKLRPGKYQLKFAVADEKGKVGTAEQALAIPPMPSSGIAASSLVVSQQMAYLPELIQSLQARLLDESDPLIYKGIQISAPVENQLSRQHPAVVFYKLYNLKSSEDDTGLTAKVQLIDEKGKANTFPPIALKELAYPSGNGEVAIGFNLPVKDLAPGKYQLTVETVDTAAKQSVSNQTELVLE
jgi:VWFA-related protein